VADSILDQLRNNYDERHGVVNVRPVVDNLLKTSTNPFAEVSATFRDAEPRWRMPILEAMRVLAASGKCTEEGAQDVLKATEAVAVESGDDEYFKTINALVASPKAATALTAYVLRLLEMGRNSFARRLAFYTVGMLLEHRTAQLSDGLHNALKYAAEEEKSEQLKRQFQELLNRF